MRQEVEVEERERWRNESTWKGKENYKEERKPQLKKGYETREETTKEESGERVQEMNERTRKG